MAIVDRKIERGLMRSGKGWIYAEREVGVDDSGTDDSGTDGPRTVRRKMLAGPFVGPGSKAQAIRAAGTNRVLA